MFHISAIVEPKWTHSDAMHLFAKKAAGRSIRHHALNELVARALSAARGVDPGGGRGEVEGS